MPLKEAVRLPIHLYGRIDLCDKIPGGRISFGNKPRFGGWIIGLSKGPTFGNNHDVTNLCVEGELILGNHGLIRNGCTLCIRKNSIVKIGTDFDMADRSKIISLNNITIGNTVRVSWESQVFDTNFHYVCDVDSNVHRLTSPVSIGDYSWIGNRVTINKGTCLGNYSIVASNSLVNKDFGNEEHCIYGGIPARKLKSGYTRLYWDKQIVIDKWFAAHPDKEICNINNIDN